MTVSGQGREGRSDCTLRGDVEGDSLTQPTDTHSLTDTMKELRNGHVVDG